MGIVSASTASLADRAKSWPLFVLPHHLMSRLVLAATRLRRPRALKNLAIRSFVRLLDVDVAEAAETVPEAYGCFNDFFTRPLQPGVRPIADGGRTVVCPIDGRVSQVGEIDGGRILQAKGRSYSLRELVGGDPRRAALFRGGRFANLYLSPRDYHRIHMPCDGTLYETVYIPGRLFAVAPHSVRVVPRLFARNERLVAVFETAGGPLAVILVGALFVGCIETVWGGVVTPPHGDRIRVEAHRDTPLQLKRGDELGRFNMGSTVILLFAPGAVDWQRELLPDAAVRVGRKIGRFTAGGKG